MIVIIAVLAILLLIACVGYSSKCKELEQCKADELMRFNIMRDQFFASQKEVDELKAELSERPLPVQPEESETGSFIRSQAMRRATPETYRNVFDLDVNGQRVIDHLQLTFANKSTYVRGGQDAERESCFKAGQAAVIGFILNQINKANDPNYKDEVNDSASE